jgi:hypothetical protein
MSAKSVVVGILVIGMANRFAGPEEYAELIGVDVSSIETRSMSERVEEDYHNVQRYN